MQTVVQNISYLHEFKNVSEQDEIPFLLICNNSIPKSLILNQQRPFLRCLFQILRKSLVAGWERGSRAPPEPSFM